MSNKLSVKEKVKLASAYNSLLDDKAKKIHKRDLKTLKNILKKCDKVEVVNLLMVRVGPCPRTLPGLINKFADLFDKLKLQNSAMYEKKEDMLNYIQGKLILAMRNHINGTIDFHLHTSYLLSGSISEVDSEISRLQGGVSYINKKIEMQQGDIISLQKQKDDANSSIQRKQEYRSSKKEQQKLILAKVEELKRQLI